jgi:hypothetical protein
MKKRTHIVLAGFVVFSLAAFGTLWVRAGGGATVAFQSANFSVVEGEGNAVITVVRLAGADGPASVSYRTVAGTATAGSDYVETTGSLAWLDGDDDPKTFSVPIIDDSEDDERAETVELELFNPGGGASIGQPATATLTITDDEDGPGPPPACQEDEKTLCLQNDRFRITTRWRRPNGEVGDGMGVELTSDTGYFWFFNANNVEMVIKLLKGCGNNGHYWVFAGGLTNVEVDITVVDTKTETEKTYRNTLLQPFQPIQDVKAFETCP